MFKTFFRLFIYTVGYLATTAGLMYGCLSFLTGRFPPPMNEIYAVIKSMHSAFDVKALQQMSKIQAQRAETLEHVEGSVAENAVTDQSKEEEIRSLKYENTYLKSRLDNCAAPTSQSR